MLEGIDEILDILTEVFAGAGEYLQSFTLEDIVGGLLLLLGFIVFYFILILV